VANPLDYLGYRGRAADSRVAAAIDEIRGELAGLGEPKSIYKFWECAVDGGIVRFDNAAIASADLVRHLAGCTQLAIFAITLGAAADTLLRRYSAENIGRAAIADAVASAMIDNFCDNLETEISKIIGKKNTTRFSPGFGDFDFVYQKLILDKLNAQRIGIFLTDAQMLVPQKSITAIIGFGGI